MGEPNLVRPSTLKYVAPKHVSTEKYGGQSKEGSAPMSPLIDRKNSIGSEGSCFSKPALS